MRKGIYFLLIFLYLSTVIFAQETIIIDDDLQGSTEGTKVGGSFSSEGYKPGIGSGHILYDSPSQVANGYIEFEIKGFSASAVKADADNGFMGMYDGRGINEPIQYSDDFKENFFRWNFHWRESRSVFKGVISCAEPTSERLNAEKAVYTLLNSPEDEEFPGQPERDWSLEPNGTGYSFNSSNWYTIKIEWKNKSFKAFVNGTQVWSTSGPYDYVPIDFKIWIGSAPGSGDKYTNSVADIVYRNFKLVSYGTPSGTPPSAPSTLEADADGSSQINLSWDDNSNNESGFKIERKTGTAGSWSQIATVGSGTTTYQNTGLTSSTTYYYRVRAYNSSGNSSYSNEADATTSADVPSSPSDLTVNAISSSQINLNWTDNSDDEDGFKIERKIGTGGAWSQIDAVNSDVTTHQDTGLISNTTYYYRIRAYNSSGNSSYSNEANATTSEDVPAAPTNLSAGIISSTQINLIWTDNSNNEEGFYIYRELPDDSVDAVIAVGANVTEYQDTNLVPNTTYYYRVKSFNSSGTSENSNIDTATTNNTTPLAPLDLNISVINSTQINLSWTDNSNNEDGFKIERKSEQNGDWVQIAMVENNNVTYQDTGLASNYTYYYRVVSFNSAGNSAYSNEVSATLTGIEDLEFSEGDIKSYMLYNNYPNPFNPSTIIQFNIPEESINSLKVYDVTGKEAAKILENEILHAGTYKYKFSSHSLPSGIYFYVLLSSSNISNKSFKSVKKMILLK